MRKKDVSIVAFFILLSVSCEKDATMESKAYPIVRTKEVTNIDSTGATFSAEIISPGTEGIIDYGFFLKRGEDLSKFSTFDSANADGFIYRCTADIESNQLYSVMAYVTSNENIVIGASVEFVGKGSLKPEIVSFHPQSGFDETEVKLHAKHISAIPNNNRVYLNGELCDILSVNKDTIVFKTPIMSYVGEASISLSSGLGSTISEQKFTIIGPEIVRISNSKAFSGDYLIIEGSNFLSNGDDLQVWFGFYEAKIIQAGADRIEVVVPSPSSVFNDFPMSVKIKNGKKETKYNGTFIIKKNWEIKAHPDVAYNGYLGDGFVYGSNAYLVNHFSDELLEYNSKTDQWSVFSDYHDGYTSQSIFLEYKGKILQFGGGETDNFWEFNFDTKEWLKREDLAFHYNNATYFRIENDVFIVTNDSQFWKYNLDAGMLTRLNDFPEAFYGFAFAFVAEGVPYAITYGTTWQYNMADDIWSVKSSNPIKKSNYSQDALGFMLKGSCYILQNGQDLYKHSMENDGWDLVSSYPGSRGDNSKKITFLIDDQVYFAAIASNFYGSAPLLYCFTR